MDFGQPNMNSSEPAMLDAQPQEPVVEVQRSVSFADGFQFGCGFWAAAVIAGILTVLGLLILNFGLGLVGITLF